MIIASPWSRGGCVCSQVFDHTSPLQFLEKFLSHKTGKRVQETNINQWRRTVCGDLTSAFQPYSGEELKSLPFPERDAFIEEIHRAKFKELPSGYQSLTPADLEQICRAPLASPRLPRQEPGVRRSCPLPYELVVDGTLTDDRRRFTIRFEAREELFGKDAAGSPFTVYARHDATDVRTRNYAVAPGDRLEDSWALGDFADGRYQLAVYGPNGFYREFRGDANDPPLEIRLDYSQTTATDPPSGNVEVHLINRDDRRRHTIEIVDLAYKNDDQRLILAPGDSTTCAVKTQHSFGWYDLGVRVVGSDLFERRYAGRVETGAWSFSDPVMGRV